MLMFLLPLKCCLFFPVSCNCTMWSDFFFLKKEMLYLTANARDTYPKLLEIMLARDNQRSRTDFFFHSCIFCYSLAGIRRCGCCISLKRFSVLFVLFEIIAVPKEFREFSDITMHFFRFVRMFPIPVLMT